MSKSCLETSLKTLNLKLVIRNCERRLTKAKKRTFFKLRKFNLFEIVNSKAENKFKT